jgi:hypothetical protein
MSALRYAERGCAREAGARLVGSQRAMPHMKNVTMGRLLLRDSGESLRRQVVNSRIRQRLLLHKACGSFQVNDRRLPVPRFPIP